MIETLIAASSAVTTIVTVSCTDINTLVDRAKVYPDLSVEERQEIINLYYEFGDKYGLDCRDAKADWRNGFKKSNYFRRNQIAQVTYRGVVYDTDRNKAKQTNKVDLTYRGVRLEKELTSVKWLKY